MNINTNLSAHDLVQRVFEQAVESLYQAEHATHADRFQDHLKKAIALLRSLQSSLDLELGGTLASNLDDLYSYMLRRLTAVEERTTREPLREVRDLVCTLKEAWQAIQPSIAEESIA